MNGYGFLLQAMKTVSLQGKTIAYKAGLCKMLSRDPNDEGCNATKLIAVLSPANKMYLKS